MAAGRSGLPTTRRLSAGGCCGLRAKIQQLLLLRLGYACLAEAELLTLEHTSIEILNPVGGVGEPLRQAGEEGREEAAGEAGLIGVRVSSRYAAIFFSMPRCFSIAAMRSSA